MPVGVAPAFIWPEVDKNVAGVALSVNWQQSTADEFYRLTTSSSDTTHYPVSLSSFVGMQPYPGTSSRMILKGSLPALLQYQTDVADSTFFYHADVWLAESGGVGLFSGESSDESLYFGSSSSTALFVLSTAQATTTIYMGTMQPAQNRGVRVWERG